MIKKEDVLKVLSQIIDPDLNKDIVSLGFIKNLKIEGSFVSFAIELTTAGCPLKNMFRSEAEKLVKALDGVETVDIEMTARAKQTSNSVDSLKGVKHVIAVASAKGGVGKSTVAATLASEFASRGFKVGLLDTDLFGPSLPTLFNIHESQIVQKNGMLIPMDYKGMKFMSFGFLLGDSPAIMRGPMVSGYIQQLLTTVEWGELDYLFIDMPPGTGDIQLTISQTIKLDGALIVTTRSSLSLVDVSRGILMFETVQIPILGVIENMAYFICDNCDKEHYIFGEKKSDLTDRFGVETIAHIPVDSARSKPFDAYESNQINRELADTLIRQIGKRGSGVNEAPEVETYADRIVLKWKNEKAVEVSNLLLRDNCKCALCVDEYSGEKTLKKEDIPDDIHALKVTPLGNYALSVQWSDGHSSSIYPYKTLKSFK